MTTPHLLRAAEDIDWHELRTAIAEALALAITVAITARPALFAASQALGNAWVAALGLTPAPVAPEAPQAVPVAPVAAKATTPIPQPFEPVLGDLRVSELRKLARQQGLSHLGRRGRKAELLEALAS